MKRLLAISWEMPPMYGPRATQVARTVAALGEVGWHSTVVCLAPRAGGPHSAGDRVAPPAPNVDLVRVPSPEEWPVWRVLSRVAPVLRDLPDPHWVWIRRAARAACAAASTGGVSGLVTFGQPWSDHLCGLRVHRATGLPWVAHFSDPWADSPYASAARWQRRLARRMEREVIAAADALVFVTSETADLVMAKYPAAWRGKVSVVPHGFSRSIAPETRGEAAPARRADRPLRVVHTGRFYAGVRTPDALLRAVASLRSRHDLERVLAVQMIGPHAEPYVGAARALGVTSIVTFQPRVAPEQAEAAAAAADVLLVIDAPSAEPSVFLPSKLIDYLPLRKPILALTPGSGATASLVRRLGGVVAPPDDPDRIAAALECLIAQWSSGTLGVGRDFDEVAAAYDIRRTTAQFAAVLSAAFGGRTS